MSNLDSVVNLFLFLSVFLMIIPKVMHLTGSDCLSFFFLKKKRSENG